RALMRKAGVMAIEEHFHTIKRESTDDFGRPVVHESRKAFSRGERLVFTRNHKAMGVKNGTLGTIEEIDKHKLKVRIDGDNRVVSFASKLYPYFDRGWAITIIKSQGSTADRVFKLATFEEDRNLAYVGMTRHRESLQVFGSRLDFWREEIFGDRLSQNREKLASTDYVSQEEAQSRLKPPARLREALSSLGNRLESLGYYSRKGWESVCERFLGQTRPEDRIMFARSSLEESRRALEMGINAAPSSGNRAEQLAGILHTLDAQDASSSSDLVSGHASAVMAREEDACPKAMLEKQNEPRNSADHPESVLSPLSQSTFQNAGVREGNVASSGAEKASLSAVSLPVDISAFVDEQAKVDASQKATPSPDVREQGKNQKPSLYRAPSVSKEPYYSLEEVRRSLTSYGIENICTSLLGEPNQRISTRRHLRYGNSGSLAVSLSGSSLGLWKDHSRDEGGDRFKLVQRERGGDFKEALAYVAEALRVAPERSPHQGSRTPPSSEKAEEARRLDRVNRLLESSRPLEGTLTERYLREHRGIQGELSSDLRFIPRAWHSGAKAYYPALASLARDSYGTVTALQLVYLDVETSNKADVDLKKQSFGLVKGSYVQIQKGDGAVFVAEGVETALSIREADVKGDIYAALGIANFKNMSSLIQDKTQPIVMCADQDGEGSPSHKVVEKAKKSLEGEGFSVSVIRPSKEQGKQDFNDVLKREGVERVRRYLEVYRDISERQAEGQVVSEALDEKAVKELLRIPVHPKDQDTIKESVTHFFKENKIPDDQVAQKGHGFVHGQEKASEPALDAVHSQLSQSADSFNVSAQEKTSLNHPSIFPRSKLDDYRQMVLSNRVESCLKLILKSDLFSEQEQEIKENILERISFLSAFKDINIFETTDIKPYCQAYLMEEKVRENYREEAASYNKTDMDKSWEIQNRADRVASLAGRLAHERFFSQGILPKIPEQTALMKEAEAVFRQNKQKEGNVAWELILRHGLPPTLANQSATQIMILCEKIGMNVAPAVQKAIVDICKQTRNRLESYAVHTSFVKGGREQWHYRSCQQAVEASFSDRGVVLPERLISLEKQTYREVLKDQKTAIDYQKEQQHKLEREKSKQLPSKDFGIER
ncbi:MAG: toprim domain-containing protein, partial [Caedimonas sp.]|nr:toprim domain-containing protein [Caedimonas sp.]